MRKRNTPKGIRLIVKDNGFKIFDEHIKHKENLSESFIKIKKKYF